MTFTTSTIMVLGVSRRRLKGISTVSGGCFGDSWYYLEDSHDNSIVQTPSIVLVAGSLIGPWLAIEWPILGCLLVSGRWLSDSESFLGCMMCKQLITIKFWTFLISLFPFPELLRLVKMCNILGCLYGVWKVFGRHLGFVWVTLDTVRGVRCANTYFTHFHQLIPFLPVASNYSKWAIFWGVRRVSGGCLGGVWELSEWTWILSGEYVFGSIEKKSILGHFNQLQHFLTVANFRRLRAQNAKFQV